MAGGGAPVAVTGAAADGADLHRVARAGDQVVQHEATGIAVQAAIEPWAGCAIGANHGIPKFVALGVGNGFPELDQQFAAVAVDDVEDEWHGHGGSGAAGAGRCKTA